MEATTVKGDVHGHVHFARDSTRIPEHRLVFAMATKLPLRFLAHSGPLLTEASLLASPDAHLLCLQG